LKGADAASGLSGEVVFLVAITSLLLVLYYFDCRVLTHKWKLIAVSVILSFSLLQRPAASECCGLGVGHLYLKTILRSSYTNGIWNSGANRPTQT
jgi:hypothetical protein